jgi:hypothetical protein
MGCHETPHLPCTARVCDRPEEEGPGSGGDPWPPGSPPPPDGSGGSGGNGDGDCDPNDLNCHEPDPCQQPDPPAHCTNPCQTGNETIDDTSFQELMEQAYAMSNADAEDQDLRIESLWAIYPSGDSYDKSQLHAAVTTPCELRGPWTGNPDAVNNAVVFLHVHPFQTGEVITSPLCEDDKIGNRYSGFLSRADSLAQAAFSRPFVMIDKDGLSYFDGTTSTQNAPRFERCGF